MRLQPPKGRSSDSASSNPEELSHLLCISFGVTNYLHSINTGGFHQKSYPRMDGSLMVFIDKQLGNYPRMDGFFVEHVIKMDDDQGYPLEH